MDADSYKNVLAMPSKNAVEAGDRINPHKGYGQKEELELG